MVFIGLQICQKNSALLQQNKTNGIMIFTPTPSNPLTSYNYNLNVIVFVRTHSDKPNPVLNLPYPDALAPP